MTNTIAVMTKENFMKAINWNKCEDPKDLEVWNTLVTNFWVPEKIPVSNDIASWDSLSSTEREMTMRVFTGLTMLDTLQAVIGAPSLAKDAVTQIEESVFAYIAMQEAVHAKSYSNIFSTLCSSTEIERAFEWSEKSPHLQKKAKIIFDLYTAEPVEGENELMVQLRRKAASTVLESFLFYSGFYLPLHWTSQSKLTNSGDMINLIIRDESIHGYYIGYKFQQGYALLTEEEQGELMVGVIEVLDELMANEESYVDEIYTPELTADVKRFLRYNANKTLTNLGLGTLYPDADCQVNPAIMASLSPTSDENHDFFSGSGSSYIIGKAEATSDDDWDF